jgi:predicted ribosome quality control (RQC) complex YloA/Tae2 family protein
MPAIQPSQDTATMTTTASEAVDQLWKHQLRRENAALLKRIEEDEKHASNLEKTLNNFNERFMSQETMSEKELCKIQKVFQQEFSNIRDRQATLEERLQGLINIVQDISMDVRALQQKCRAVKVGVDVESRGVERSNSSGKTSAFKPSTSIIRIDHEY